MNIGHCSGADIAWSAAGRERDYAAVLCAALAPACRLAANVEGMFSAYGWCRIATARPPVLGTNESDLEAADAADEVLWAEFRRYMAEHESSFLKWQFFEHLNNDCGVLTFTDSKNHRTSSVFEMFDWIAEHGKGSFGLMYVLDDEDERSRFGGTSEHSYTTVHRVHRLLEGEITEHEDPFFGVIAGLS